MHSSSSTMKKLLKRGLTTSSSKPRQTPVPTSVSAAATATATPSPSPAKDQNSVVRPSSKNNDEEFIGMTGGQIFHKMLARNNVEVVFGYPGGAILPAFDAIHESPHFRFVLPRHEQGGGHMAEGYYRATGKPGVVLVTSGPGATNTVTPLLDAMMDGTPLIVFSGQVATSAIGSDAFQEADTIGITRHCTKWNVLVKDIRELPRRINEAFHIATSGRPGSVLVDLPKDVTAGVLKTPAESDPIMADRMKQKEKLIGLHRFPAPNDDDMKRVADMINNAKKPIIYAGQGIIQAAGGKGYEILRKFAEKANIPVTTTLQGLGAFDETHPLSLHMLGMHGSYYANQAMQSADVIIALGARFDDRVTGKLTEFAPAAKKAEAQGRGGIIHFEISPKQLNKVIKPTEAVLGDVAGNLNRVLPLVTFQKREEWHSQINEWKTKYPFTYKEDEILLKSKGNTAILPQKVIEELYRQTKHLGDNLVVTTGVGQHQMWAAQYMRWRFPRTWITSGGAGTMGFGVPAAIGAKVGCPHKTVIDIDGDASFAMTGMELLTARQFDIPVKILILNNHFQGMVKTLQSRFYNRRFSATEMTNPCFADMAKAMGITGIRLEKEEDLPNKIAEFLACKGPVILDAQVEKELDVYPVVPAGRALHDMILGPHDF